MWISAGHVLGLHREADTKLSHGYRHARLVKKERKTSNDCCLGCTSFADLEGCSTNLMVSSDEHLLRPQRWKNTLTVAPNLLQTLKPQELSVGGHRGLADLDWHLTW